MEHAKVIEKSAVVRASLPAQLQAGQIEINVRATAAMHYTAVAARRKVNVLLLEKVGTGLFGDEPDLVITDRVYWRVPVILALPKLGRLGQVGVIDVDVQTGQVLAEPKLLEEIATHATHLVTGATSSSE